MVLTLYSVNVPWQNLILFDLTSAAQSRQIPFREPIQGRDPCRWDDVTVASEENEATGVLTFDTRNGSTKH